MPKLCRDTVVCGTLSNMRAKCVILLTYTYEGALTNLSCPEALKFKTHVTALNVGHALTGVPRCAGVSP